MASAITLSWHIININCFLNFSCNWSIWFFYICLIDKIIYISNNRWVKSYGHWTKVMVMSYYHYLPILLLLPILLILYSRDWSYKFAINFLVLSFYYVFLFVISRHCDVLITRFSYVTIPVRRSRVFWTLYTSTSLVTVVHMTASPMFSYEACNKEIVYKEIVRYM